MTQTTQEAPAKKVTKKSTRKATKKVTKKVAKKPAKAVDEAVDEVVTIANKVSTATAEVEAGANPAETGEALTKALGEHEQAIVTRVCRFLHDWSSEIALLGFGALMGAAIGGAAGAVVGATSAAIVVATRELLLWISRYFMERDLKARAANLTAA